MKAIRIHGYGGPEQLILEDVPVPEPQAGQVLIKMQTAGVNPYEWKLREGYFKNFNPLTFPVIPGSEGTGVITELGPGVSKFKKEQVVYGHVLGSYAEYSLASANNIFLKPSHISSEEASALPIGTQTAWSSLIDIAGLQAGQTVLIHGGAGNVGTYAIQLSKWRGAKVIATASAENVKFVRKLGADEVINYQATQFDEAVCDIDVVFDTVGGETQDKSWRVLRKGGVLVSIVSPPSKEMAQKFGVTGAFRDRGISQEGLKQIQKLIDQDILKPKIRQVFPLAEAGKAQELSQTGHGQGKIILSMS